MIIIGIVCLIVVSVPVACVVFTLCSDDAVLAAGCIEEGQVW
jgi:hypothetical protein